MTYYCKLKFLNISILPIFLLGYSSRFYGFVFAFLFSARLSFTGDMGNRVDCGCYHRFPASYHHRNFSSKLTS